ncbi:MAG TPA: carboxypeptidase-like regulatory domain-containing protein [Alphaproteobacteria bacterium]|nr:carboxypeptidase-like regulatory domain-containing protein [Alphaproteobacteria bacterium]
MKRNSMRATSMAGAVFGAALAASGIAWANGGEFFLPAPEHGKVDLVYFGHIKDTDGNYIDNAQVTVSVKDLGLTFPFDNDSPGHYRSPDIGAQIKDIGEKVDPSQISIAINKKGYSQVNQPRVPAKADGTYEIDFVLAKDKSS